MIKRTAGIPMSRGGRHFPSLVVAGFLATLSLASAQDFVVERDVMIPARDGISLATDIYLPALDGIASEEVWPIVLTRTPYSKDRERDVAFAQLMARHGYVAAIQDIRGRYQSQGRFTKYSILDAPDGFDTIEWLSQQPYSDGRVGMWGTSYGAHTQADAAKLNPPALKAMLLNQGGMTNAWDHAVRHGGAFELGRELTWAFRQIPEEQDDPVIQAFFASESISDWYQALPLRRGQNPLSIAPAFEAYFFEELTRSDYSDYWKKISLNWTSYYEQTADATMLHVGGWYDIFLRGTIQNFQSLRELKDSPVQLLIGPWTHSGNTRTYAGDVDFGNSAAIEDFHGDFQRRWFDRYLKYPESASGRELPVRVFVMGSGDGRRTEEGRLQHGGYWVESETWPLPGLQPTPFYFAPEGGLVTEKPTQAIAETTFTADPEHPVPTLGGNVSARVNDGAYDQRERADFPGSREPYLPLKARRDVVVFQTEPLTEDVVVAGPLEVVLYASTSATDTDFTAKLIDVYPPSLDFPGGFDMNISDAILRASYRDDRTTRNLVEPGETYRFVIRPFATANIFKKGHRIRVDISSSNFPRFDVNPNTGEPLGLERRVQMADNTIYHDAERPSHILLPLLTRRPQPAGPTVVPDAR